MPSAIVIDDSPIMRAQLRKLLVSAGFSVVAESGTGSELFALYEQYRPDLITLDIVMPGRDGASAAAELLAVHPEATIAMCTSLASRERIDMCRQAGVKYYLLKPFNPEYALAIFCHVLDGQALEKQVADRAAAAAPDDPPPPVMANPQRDEMVG